MSAKGGVAVMPQRIQRRREKGWRVPEGAVYVGRPTRWGNPYSVADREGSRKEAVRLYRHAMTTGGVMGDHGFIKPEDVLRELRGRDLMCWCPLDQPCHADVLLDIANKEESAAK